MSERQLDSIAAPAKRGRGRPKGPVATDGISQPGGKGGQRCQTCNHAMRHEIEGLWASGLSYHSLQNRYDIDSVALRRHFGAGGSTGPGCKSVQQGLRIARDRIIQEHNDRANNAQATGDVIYDKCVWLVDQCEKVVMQIVDDDEQSGRDKAACLMALNKGIELLARIMGRLSEVQINITDSREYKTLMDAVWSVLAPHPHLMQSLLAELDRRANPQVVQAQVVQALPEKTSEPDGG